MYLTDDEMFTFLDLLEIFTSEIRTGNDPVGIFEELSVFLKGNPCLSRILSRELFEEFSECCAGASSRIGSAYCYWELFFDFGLTPMTTESTYLNTTVLSTLVSNKEWRHVQVLILSEIRLDYMFLFILLLEQYELNVLECLLIRYRDGGHPMKRVNVNTLPSYLALDVPQKLVVDNLIRSIGPVWVSIENQS